jgi:hypothetical protein
MSQDDQSIANAGGATVRADINSNLQALATLSSGAAAPSPTWPNQWWMDTTANILKQRDNANTAWINVASKVGSVWVPYRDGTLLGTAAVETIGMTGAVVPKLDGANRWSAAQRGDVVTLTDAANIATDMSLGNNFTVTLAGNRTLDNPTNQVAGQGGIVVIKQDATGTRTLAYGANWKFEGGFTPTLSTAASAIDVLAYFVESSGVVLASLTKGWA